MAGTRAEVASEEEEEVGEGTLAHSTSTESGKGVLLPPGKKSTRETTTINNER